MARIEQTGTSRIVLAAIGLGVALCAVLLWRGAVGRVRGPVAGPFILISIDTLRADHLPAYGYSQVRTPAIDALAAEGVLFERAYSHSPQTLPAHTSILTGELPFEHGVRDNIGFTVRGNQRTLPQLLRGRGYATGAAVSAYVLRKETGIGQGFDFYDSQLPPASPEASIGQVQRDGLVSLEVATRWMDGLSSNKFFLFLHLYEPHKPYSPPAEFASYAPYDGEIAYADQIIGRLVVQLRARDLYDDATVIVLSDHGEGLGDHGEQEHGVFLYDETTRVPLIVKLPRSASAGRRVTAPVQHVDLVPTVLDLVGAPPEQGLRGRSLRPLLAGSGSIAAAGIYAEALYPRYHFGWSELYTLTEDRYRYVKAPREELYDLPNDPKERRNLAGERPRPSAAMRAALDKLIAGRAVERPASVSAESRQQFQALGYIGMPAAEADPRAESAGADPKDKIHVLEAYRRGIALAGEQRFDEAVSVLRAIVAEEPRMADVWEQLGGLLTRAGRPSEAADAYRRFVELKPEEPGGLVQVATALFKLREIDDARAHAELAVKTAKKEDVRARASAHELLARISLARRDRDEAARQAELAQQADPTLPLPTFIQGLMLHADGRYAEALPRFEETLRLIGSRSIGLSELHFYTGDTLARLGRNAEAEAELRKEIALSPQNHRARGSLAMLYRAVGRDRESEQVIEQMTRSAPTPDAYAMADQLWTMFGEPERAAAVRAQARAQFGSRRSVR